MKANMNHLPYEFRNYNGKVIEANLAELVAEFPLFKEDIQRCLDGYAKEPLQIDFKNEKYIIRFAIRSGTLAASEIGYINDEWAFEPDYIWSFGKIKPANNAE